MGETRGFGDGMTEPQSTRMGFLKVVAASAGVATLPLATWQQSAAAAPLVSEPALAARVAPIVSAAGCPRTRQFSTGG